MLEGDLRYPHGRLACFDATPVDLDSSHYFQTRCENLNSYRGYSDYYWGEYYAKFDAHVPADLA